MQAVILAGGIGSRLKPLTDFIPKPLLPLPNGKSIVENLIDKAMGFGFDNILLTLCFKHSLIRKYLKKRGYEVKFVIEKSPLGTAGCLKNAEKYLDETFLVLSADNYTEHNLRELFNFHLKLPERPTITLALVKPSNPRDYAIVKLGSGNVVIKIKEKPKGKLFSKITTCGTYVIDKEILDFIPKNKIFDISFDLLPLLIKKKIKIYGKFMKGIWEDVGTFEKYAKILLKKAGL